jgi:hypothetical protein
MFFSCFSFASTQKHTTDQLVECKATLPDLGNIEVIGKGNNIHQARSVASHQCFELRMNAFERIRKTLPQGEQEDHIIDSCVNIRCS